MDQFTVYSKPDCSFCDRAKQLLESKGLAYEEVIVDVGQEKLSTHKYITINQLKALVPGVRTVPQIFKNGELVGGFDALRLIV